MGVIHERIRRGVPGFPLGFYNQARKQEGICITPLHYHNDLEFLLPLTGTVKVLLGGETILVHQGSLCAYHAGVPHAIYSGSSDTHYLCLVIPKELLLLDPENTMQQQLIEPLYTGTLQLTLITQKDRIISLAQEICALCKDIQKNKYLLTAMLFQLLALYEQKGLIRQSKALSLSPVHAAISYMEQNLSEHIDLQNIAATVGMSHKYFCTYFKNQSGSTPITYLTTLRIRRACILLKDPTLSVLQVAGDCGFDNVSFFIKRFKEATGQTPGQYRKAKEN
jgi:AraC-like DNA-binding protein